MSSTKFLLFAESSLGFWGFGDKTLPLNPNFAKLGYSKTDTITLPWENEAHIYEKTLLRTGVLIQSAR
jgi:hypothetical protein